jgi:PE-PPE domain
MHAARAARLIFFAFATFAATILGSPVTTSTPVRLAGTYALKGTQVPGISEMTDAQVGALANQYVRSTYGTPPAPLTVVNYPGTLFPLSGFTTPTADQSEAAGLAQLTRDTAGDRAPVIFGYSQGAVVASQYKEGFNQHYATTVPPNTAPTPTFVLIGNPDRPNGGIFERFAGLYIPGLDLSFNGATPTQTAGATPEHITTYDIAGQYDGFADYPTYPINLLADINAVLGILYVHTHYQDLDASTAVLQDRHGDTAYYLIPTARLPLLQPLAQLGVPAPILAALDAPLRVLVEAGYARTTSPGQPTTAGVLPAANPLRVAADFLAAIPTGLDDGLQEIGAGRPLHTTPAGPYGVGGPPVTLPANTLTVSNATPQTSHPATATPSTTSPSPTNTGSTPKDTSPNEVTATASTTSRSTDTVGLSAPSAQSTQTRHTPHLPSAPRTVETELRGASTTRPRTDHAESDTTQGVSTRRPPKHTAPDAATPAMTPTASRTPAPHRPHPRTQWKVLTATVTTSPDHGIGGGTTP